MTLTIIFQVFQSSASYVLNIGRDIYVDRAFIGVNRKSIIRRKKKKIDPIQDAHSKSPIVMGYRLQAKECIFDYHIRYRSSFSLTQAISQLPTHLRLLPLDTLAEPALDKFNSGRPCNLSSSPGVSKPHGHCIFLTGRPVGQTIAMGVAILDEIDPLALHNIRNSIVRLRPIRRGISIRQIVERVIQL